MMREEAVTRPFAIATSDLSLASEDLVPMLGNESATALADSSLSSADLQLPMASNWWHGGSSFICLRNL